MMRVALGAIKHANKSPALLLVIDTNFRKCGRQLLSITVLVGLFGCTMNKPDADADADIFVASLTPPAWHYSDTWIFRVVNDRQRELGEIVLLLTGKKTSADSCAENGSNKAVVINNSLDIDFGFELDPAFTLHGRWLRIDLTASTCDVDHVLYGEVNAKSANGFFNYSHPLGGYNIGTFRATPAMSKPDLEDGTID